MYSISHLFHLNLPYRMFITFTAARVYILVVQSAARKSTRVPRARKVNTLKQYQLFGCLNLLGSLLRKVRMCPFCYV